MNLSDNIMATIAGIVIVLAVGTLGISIVAMIYYAVTSLSLEQLFLSSCAVIGITILGYALGQKLKGDFWD